MTTFHRLNPIIGNKVLDKFQRKCQTCGTSNNLVVHYIKPLPIEHVDYNNENNLTVLCRSCHMSLHRKSGDIPTSKSTGPINGRLRSQEFCSEPGCDKVPHAKGFCRQHYYIYKDKPNRVY